MESISVGDFEYEVKDFLGHGAFAVVYQGRHKKNKDASSVAIKSIAKKNLSKSHNLLGKEIKILKELSEVHHENIVGLLDCQETQSHVFLVMEYCNGGDFAEYLLAKGTLSEDAIRYFLRQLAGAMQALQQKGIVHRDLKPQNILLSFAEHREKREKKKEEKEYPPWNEIRLKIADFGFARFLQDGVMAATLCGSPMYMAPEVIMSLQYDAKADLWSLGTIVFQCLTGRAPFTAQTPQQLKNYYERNHNLSPKIPVGTSPDLVALLKGLLRRNAKERMEFDEFFNHAFIRRPQHPDARTPFARQPTPPKSPPAAARAAPVASTVPRPVLSTVPSRPAAAHLEEADDFVLVPSPNQTTPAAPGRRPEEDGEIVASQPIPVPSQRDAYLKLQASLGRSDASPGSSPSGGRASPAGSGLPRSRPISVAGKAADDQANAGSGETAKTATVGDINSLSPPSVQFCVGTPPGALPGPRRRSTSGSSCGTSPPWPHLVSSPLRRGSSAAGALPCAGTAPGPLAPIMGSPRPVPYSVSEAATGPARTGLVQWAPGHHPTRTMTLPEFTTRAASPAVAVTAPHGIHGFQRSNTDVYVPGSPAGARSPLHFNYSGSSATGLYNSHGASSWSLQRKPSFEQPWNGPLGFGTSPPVEGPIVFVAPELTEETLLEKEHNDTLAKLNFILALVECIVDVARNRGSPLAAALSESMHSRSSAKMASSPPAAGDRATDSATSDVQRRAEQLVLYIRALQLLSSALNLSKEELQAERLHPSPSVKQVVSMLNQRFHHCLSQCKQLNVQSLAQQLGDANAAQLTADKILYNHAIELCQSAALDELFGNPASCCRRYQTAHILFHSLSQQVTQQADKAILNKYREAVEKRLFVLQQQGFIYAYDTM